MQGALMVNDEELLQGLRRCRDLGAIPQVCLGAHVDNVSGCQAGAFRTVYAAQTIQPSH